MALELVTPPAVEPLTLAEAKGFLRVDVSTDDDLITRLITASRSYIEELAERSLCTQTWRLSLDAWPEGETRREQAIVLPRPKLRTVTSVKYVDTAGVLTTLDSSAYAIDAASEPGQVMPAYGTTWPAARQDPNAVRVEYEAGYGAAADVDPRAKQAIAMVMAHWYENREAVLTGAIAKEIEIGVRQVCTQIWHGRLW